MPRWVPDPWETIGDELEARGLSYSDLPGEIQRDGRIGEAEAICLSNFFGLSKEFWLDLQANRDRWNVENIANGDLPLAIDIEMMEQVMSIFTATVVFPIETFEGGKGANRSLYPIFNCSIEPGETLERWGEQNTWGPYGRQVENVVMGDAAPVMIWLDHYEPVTRPTTQTVEVVWVGKDGRQHQGTLWSDGQWVSESQEIPGRFGLGFIRGKVKEVFPNFFDA